MEYLGTISHPRMAQAFADHLVVQGIDIMLKPVGEAVELYVDEAFAAKAQQELAEFVKNPLDRKYFEASWQRNSQDNPLSYHSEGEGLIKKWLSHGGWVTHIILLLNVIIFFAAHLSGIYEMLRFPADGSLTQGEFWRWVTPAFMHFSLLHIVFNLLWWWLLGGMLEKHLGSVFLLLFMIFSALISNFAQYIAHHANNFGGLSGVVYALMGFCWLYGRLRPSQPVVLNDSLFGFALIWLLLGFVDALWMNVANQAHLAGLLSGLGFAWVFDRSRGRDIGR